MKSDLIPRRVIEDWLTDLARLADQSRRLGNEDSARALEVVAISGHAQLVRYDRDRAANEVVICGDCEAKEAQYHSNLGGNYCDNCVTTCYTCGVTTPYDESTYVEDTRTNVCHDCCPV